MTTVARVFRNHARRLHACGPRPVGELLSDILARLCPHCHGLMRERVERYGEMDPDIVRWVGGTDWMEPAAVVRLVARTEA